MDLWFCTVYGVNRGARNEHAMDKLLVLMLLILVEIAVCMYDVIS